MFKNTGELNMVHVLSVELYCMRMHDSGVALNRLGRCFIVWDAMINIDIYGTGDYLQKVVQSHTI
jgi:hypothetical protein